MSPHVEGKRRKTVKPKKPEEQFVLPDINRLNDKFKVNSKKLD